MHGDQLLAVNGKDLTKAYQEEAATLLKTATGRVILKLGRLKGIANSSKIVDRPLRTVQSTTKVDSLRVSPPISSRRRSSPKAATKKQGLSRVSSTTESRSKSLSPRDEDIGKKQAFYKRISRHSFRLDKSKRAQLAEIEKVNCEVIDVQLTKSAEQAWGMGIGKRASGILITSVQPNSPVDGKLRLGDQILAVNRKIVTDQASAVAMIRAAGCQVSLRLARKYS